MTEDNLFAPLTATKPQGNIDLFAPIGNTIAQPEIKVDNKPIVTGEEAANNPTTFEEDANGIQEPTLKLSPLSSPESYEFIKGETVAKKVDEEYNRHQAELNSSIPKVAQPINEQQVMDKGRKAFVAASLLNYGVKQPEIVPTGIDFKVDNTLGGLNVPTPINELSFDNSPLTKIAENPFISQATHIFENPEDYSTEEIMKLQDELSKGVGSQVGVMKQRVDELSKYKTTGELRDIKWTDENARIETEELNKRIPVYSKVIDDLNSGLNQIKQKKQFGDDFNNADIVKGYIELATNPDKLIDNLIRKQLPLSSSDFSDFLDKSQRAFSIDIDKLGNRPDLANLPEAIQNDPLAKELLSDQSDLYKMSNLARQEIGFNGTNNLIDALRKSAEKEDSPENTLSHFTGALALAKQDYDKSPTKENADKFNGLIQQENDFVNTTLVPKLALYDKLKDIVNTKFADLKERQYLQYKTDELSHKLLSNIYQGTLLTAADVLYNEMILNGKGVIGTGIELLKNQSEKDLTANVNYLQERIQEEKMITPTDWQSKQLFEWGDNGFKFHPEVALHSTVKTFLESLALGESGVIGGKVLGKLGGELVGNLAGNAFVDKESGQLLGKYLTDKTGKYTSELAGMFVGTAAMYGNDMMTAERIKGLSVKDAFTIGMVRSFIEAQTEKLFFDEVMLIEGRPINDVLLKKFGKKEVYDRVAQSYSKAFGKQLSQNGFRLLYDTKEFAKDAGAVAFAEAMEEVAGDFLNNRLDKHIQRANPNYVSSNPFDIKNEFLTTINTMATMLPTSGQAALQTKNNTIKTARYLVGKTPATYINNLKNLIQRGDLTQEQGLEQAKMISHLKSAHQLSNEDFKVIDGSDESDIDKARQKIEVFNNKLVSLQGLNKILGDLTPLEKVNLERIIEKANLSNVEILQNTQKNTNLTPEQIEEKRVVGIKNQLDNEYSDLTLQQIKTPEAIQKLRGAIQDNIVLETSDKVKEHYNKVLEKLDTREQEITIPKETVVETPKLDNHDYAKDVMKLSDTEIDNLSESELADKVTEHKSQTVQTEDEFNTQLNEALNKPNLEEKESALFDLKSELVRKKSPYADRANEEFDKVSKQIEEADLAKKTIEFQGKNFVQGEYVKYQGNTYYVDKDEKGNLKLVAKDKETGQITREVVPSDVNDFEPVINPTEEKEVKKKESPINPKNIEGKRVEINERRQKELSQESYRIKIKEETYEVLDGDDSPMRITIATNEDGSRSLLGELLIDKKYEQVGRQTIPKNNTLTNEEFIEKSWKVSQIKKISENSSPQNSIKNKINEKYDKELASLEQKPETTITVEQAEKESKEQELKGKQEVDNEVDKLSEIKDPFGTLPSYDSKGTDKTVTTLNNVLSNLSDLQNQGKKLSEEGYYVTVVNGDKLPVTLHRQSTIEALASGEYTKEQLAKSRIAVITDKEGNFLYFKQDGARTTESEGIPVFQSLSGSINDQGEFKIKNRPSKEDLIKQGILERYIAQAKKLEELRRSSKNQTFEIGEITKQVISTTEGKKNPKLVKDVFDKGDYTITVNQSGSATVTLNNTQASYPVYASLTRINSIPNLAESIVAILDTKNKDGLPDNLKNATFEDRRTWVEQNLLLTSYNLGRFRQDKDGNLEILKKDTKVEGDNAEVIRGMQLNISKFLPVDSPFTLYLWDGTKFEPKTWDAYGDFITENYKIPVEKGEVTQVKSNASVKFGDEVLPKIEEREQPKAEEPKPELEQPQKKAKESLKFEKKPRKGNTLDDSKTELKRARTFRQNVTKEQEEEGKNWFIENLGLTGSIFEDQRSVINSDAWATYRDGIITLFKGGKFTDGYHEAFHNFTQLFLTKEQKQALYKEAGETELGKKILSKLSKDTTELDKFFSIEEMLAEDFYNYMLSGKTLILNNRPKRNSIFRRIYDFIKELITGNPSLETIYEHLGNNQIANYKRNADNAYFGFLQKNIPGLDYNETLNLQKAIDSIIAQAFRERGLIITELFNTSGKIEQAYNTVYNDLNDSFEEEYANYKDELDKENPNQNKLNELEKLVQNLDFTLSNWDKVVENHKKESKFLKISKKLISEDSEGDDEENEIVAKDSIYDDSNTSAQEKASYQILYLIASLPKHVNKDGVQIEKKNSFLSNVNDVVDFETAWNQVAKTLQGTLLYSEQHKKLQVLAKQNKDFEALVNSLPSPEENLDFNKNQLKNAFVNAFSQPLIPIKIISFEKNDKELKVLARNASSTALDKLKVDWDFAIQEIPNFYTNVLNTGQKELDLGRITTDFKNIENAGKEKRLNFLNSLGFTFSPQAIESPKFQEILSVRDNTINRLYGAIKAYNELRKGIFPEDYTPSEGDKEKLSRPLVSVIDILKQNIYGTGFNIQGTKNLRLFTDVRSAIDELANLELFYSDKFFSDNVLNTQGDNQYSIKQWSQQSVDYGVLNNIDLYPTYWDLINSPLGAYYDRSRNPDADNIYIRSMFNLETGERVKDKKGNIVTIQLYDHNGLKVNNSSKTESLKEGKKTTRLTPEDKLRQDISVFLTTGERSNPRNGDKTTDRGTQISFTRLNGEVSQNPHLPVDIKDFRDGKVLSENTWLIFKNQLNIALKRTNDFYARGIGKNISNYKENIDDWGFFSGILSKSTIESINNQGVSSEKTVDIAKIIEDNSTEIYKDIEKFLKDEIEDTKKLLDNPVLTPEDYIDSYLLKQGFDTLIAAYAVNNYIVNSELIRLHLQDIRFYNSKKRTFKEFFKRTSKITSTGNIAIVDDQTNRYINSLSNAEREQFIKNNPDSIIKETPTNGDTNVVIFNDVKITPETFLKELDKKFKKAPKEEQLAIQKVYGDITVTDAMGVSTFDWYRKWQLRTGKDSWTPESERLYNKIAREEKLTKEEEKSKFLYFPPLKLRVTGRTYDKTTNQYIPFDLKFAISPLIESVVKGKQYQRIRDNMIKNGAEIGAFDSASKHAAILNSDGKFNNFYEDTDYTLNPVRTEYIFEVVPSPEDYKEEVRFSTQLRKLLFINQFKYGVPLDFRGKNFFDSSEDEKKAQSNIYRLEQEFGDVIDNLIDAEKETILRQLDAKWNETTNSYEINDNKLSEFLEQEMVKRNLPQNIIKSISTIGGRFKYPLDASIQRDTIEKVILSVIDNRLRKQNGFGEALIQAASAGYEETGLKRIDSWDNVTGDDLPSYIEEGRTLKDETKVTSAQKVKIALQGDFTKLLQHPDVLDLASKEKISPITALNRLIKDENWLNKGDNRKMITLTGVKIPVQGMNSMDFMEVYEFLPREAGSVIITSPTLVAKSGSDNDWDKITSLFPHLYVDEDGKVKYQKNVSTGQIELIYDQLKGDLEDYLKAYKTAKKDKEEEKALNDTFNQSNKLVNSIFGETDIKELIKELIKESFDNDEIPTKKQFVSLFKKKSNQNRLSEIIRETLEHPKNYEQLVTPNATYLFEPIADSIRDVRNPGKPSYSQIPTVRENITQFKSNMVGKDSLGIAAVWNTFFSQLQKAGMYLNESYVKDPTNPTSKRRLTRNRLPHNTVNIDGQRRTSLSGVYDVLGQYRISDVISQLMNGFLDVAKKDWVFYINGNKTFISTMLYTAIQGVNKDVLVAFFNQPVLNKYLKNLENYSSLLVKLKDPKLYNRRKAEAIYKTIRPYLPKEYQTTLDEKYNSGIPFFYGYVAKELRELADDNTKLFDPEYFIPFAVPEKGKLKQVEESDKLAQALYLVQYLELEEQAGILQNLRRTINQDTEKPTSLQYSNERQNRRADILKTQLFPAEIVNRMVNEGSTKAFTNDKSGIDNFIHHFSKGLFEITNHPIFNKFLYNEWSKPETDQVKDGIITRQGNNIPFNNRYDIYDSWLKTVKNDLIYYLYENYVYKQDTSSRIVDYVKNNMMNYNSALATELENIRRTYPDLVANNLLLQFLVRDNSFKKINNKPAIVSLKLRKEKIDENTSNILTQDFEKLLDFQDQNYTPEEQVVIQQFAKKLQYFAFIQSGLNKSSISFAQIVPQDPYGKEIAPVIKAFKELLDKNPEEAKKQIDQYYDLFKKQNKKFFTTDYYFETDTGKEVPEIDFNTESYRFKDYRNPNAVDLLDKKAEVAKKKENEFQNSLKTKTKVATEEWDKETAKKNPDILYLYEDNQTSGGMLGSAKVKGDIKNPEPNTVGITMMKQGKVDDKKALWTDKDYAKNVTLIDQSIVEIVSKLKEKDYKSIEFPKEGLINYSKLDESAPTTAKYLAQTLLSTFGYTINNVNLDTEFIETDSNLGETQVEDTKEEPKIEEIKPTDTKGQNEFKC